MITKIIQENTYLKKAKKYDRNLLDSIVECLDIEKVQKGKTVFLAGDRSDKMYLIACGKVCVLTPRTKPEILEAE